MEELKQQRIWVCMRLSRNENGGVNKLPISAQGKETGSDEGHASTWVTYEEAKKSAEEHGYEGVGFVVPKGYFFLDIDHRDTADSLVRKMLKSFKTYAEISVSGKGVHIYGKCDLDSIPKDTDKKGKARLGNGFYLKNSKEGIELYIGGLTNKIATVTEKSIQNVPLRDCTEAVLSILDKYMRKPNSENGGKKIDKAKDDSDIVEGLRRQKNGRKFSALYDEGDISDYGSQSEADEALCALIAYRTGPDENTIDRIFRGSRLYREKWERDDYRDGTIKKGIKACNGKFHYSVMKRPPFVLIQEKTHEPYVSVTRLAKYVRENLHVLTIKEDGKQGGQASELKYVYDENAGVYRLCSDDMFLGYIKKFITEYDENLVKMSQITEVKRLIETDLERVREEDLNADEELINLQNGLLHVTATKTELLPHTPEVLSTIQIPVNWMENPPETPVFDGYMRTLTNGDAEVEHLLLEFMGACISNVKGSRMKKSLFMFGNGDSGKSQLRSLTEKLIGKENCMTADLRDIEARFGAGFIYGTRMAGTGDMSYMTIGELKTFKKITGGDDLMAEFKGRQPFDYNYNGLLWFCMNRLPKFGGDDGKWVYDRILTVYCPNPIPKDEQNKKLLDEMYAERDGIVYKAVKALQTVIAEGYRFSEPKAVLTARKNYMEDNDSVISFFLDSMEPLKNGKVNTCCTTGRVFRVYQAWCKAYNNGYPKTLKEFQESISSYLGTTYQDLIKREHGNSYFKDYGLTKEAKQEFFREYGCPDDPDLDDFLK